MNESDTSFANNTGHFNLLTTGDLNSGTDPLTEHYQYFVPLANVEEAERHLEAVDFR